MKNKMFILLMFIMNSCELTDPDQTTISAEVQCELCKKEFCEIQFSSCEENFLCKKFDICIEEVKSSCDECLSDPDLTDGFLDWKNIADCANYNCPECDVNEKTFCSSSN